MLPQIGFEFIQEAGDFVWYHGVSAGAVMDTFISDEGTFIHGGRLGTASVVEGVLI